MIEIEYCNVYHCAGDCGQPHSQKEMRAFLTAQPAPVQEPVAWIDRNGFPHHISHLQPLLDMRNGKWKPLYTTPPAAPVQEWADEQEREAFEQHWYDFYHCGSVSARSDGTYIHPAVQKAWEAWQARAERCKS